MSEIGPGEIPRPQPRRFIGMQAGMHGVALSDAKVGTAGVVATVDLPDDVSHHLAHLGFLPGASVEVLRRAPAGDPRVYRIDGVEVGLRNETAQHIYLETRAAAELETKPAAEPETKPAAEPFPAEAIA